MSYQFLDANSSVLTAQSSVIGGFHYPIVIASIIGALTTSASIVGNVPVKGDFLETSGLSAGSLNADLVASTDVSAYRGATIQVIGTFSGTLTFQGSNDNSNWASVQSTTIGTGVCTATTATTGLFVIPVSFRYLRIRMTAYTSGTATGVLELYTAAHAFYSGFLTSILNTVAVGGSVAHDGIDSGFPTKVGGYAISAERTAVANADRVDGVFDLTGKQIVLPYSNPENFFKGVSSTITGTAAVSVIGAAGSGLRNYITAVKVTNAAATATIVDIKDGADILDTGYAAASGGGWSSSFPVPLRPGTTNAPIEVVSRSQASILVQISGYKGA